MQNWLCYCLRPNTRFLNSMFVYSVGNNAAKAKTLSGSSSFVVDTKLMSQQKLKGKSTHNSE